MEGFQAALQEAELIGDKPQVFKNLKPAQLVEYALSRNEGTLSDTGALVITTGKYTGRSPKDKFLVDVPAIHDTIAWGDTNRPIDREHFVALRDKVIEYLDGRDTFELRAFAGAEPAYAQKFRIVNESAAQALFITQLLVRPTDEQLANFGEEDFTIWVAPGYEADPAIDGTNSEAAIIIDYDAREAIICGTGYAGEIKKSVFSIMNYLMTDMGVLPMHCSANMDPETHETALFFGLSGTGKTTLSADPSRLIIGDDEHGWHDGGVFNFEGGCYAKCIDLEREKEPEIYDAIRFGALVENVIMDPDTRELDFFDSTLTENTRVGYPIYHIANAVEPSVGKIPSVVMFLTADAFGVLPPISRLSPEAAMYHFITGFTSKVAGTERGITEPVPTFSMLFGEPFMPRPASVYAEMLGNRVTSSGTRVYLVNTGWAGGSAADGANRMKLAYTRAMVTAALNGSIEDTDFEFDPIFKVDVPASVEGVPDVVLHPREYWKECGRTEQEYEDACVKLAALFEKNFAEKHGEVAPEIAAAGPAAPKE